MNIRTSIPLVVLLGVLLSGCSSLEREFSSKVQCTAYVTYTGESPGLFFHDLILDGLVVDFKITAPSEFNGQNLHFFVESRGQSPRQKEFIKGVVVGKYYSFLVERKLIGQTGTLMWEDIEDLKSQDVVR
jgi:hypothetical protein